MCLTDDFFSLSKRKKEKKQEWFYLIIALGRKYQTSPPKKSVTFSIYACIICLVLSFFSPSKPKQHKSQLNSTPASFNALQHSILMTFLLPATKSEELIRLMPAILLAYRLNTLLIVIPQAPGRCWEVEGVDVRKRSFWICSAYVGETERCGKQETGDFFCEEGAAETALLKRGSWNGRGGEGEGGWIRARSRGEEGTCYPPCSPPLWSAVRSSPPCLFSADLSRRLLYLGAASFPHLSLMLTLPPRCLYPTSLSPHLRSPYYNDWSFAWVVATFRWQCLWRGKRRRKD